MLVLLLQRIGELRLRLNKLRIGGGLLAPCRRLTAFSFSSTFFDAVSTAA